MKKKLVVTFICAGLVVLISFKLLVNKKKLDEKNRPKVEAAVSIPVTTTKVTEEEQVIKLVKTGVLAPFRETKVLSPVSGIVLKLLFEAGDKVREGQPLVVIDTRLLEIDLSRAESNADKLKEDLQTYMELFEGKAATEQKVRELRQLYRDALNLVRQLRRQIADATIRAPATGVADLKEVEEGTYITTGAAVTSVIDQSRLKVKINFTESEVYGIRTGEKIRLTTAVEPGMDFWGTVTFISPKANEAYNYPVELTTNGNNDGIVLRPGTFVYADFSRQTHARILLVPREALNENTQDVSVYIVDGGRARLRSITVAGSSGDTVHVTGGLQPGTEVITSGQINLRDGAIIHISKQQH